MFDVFYLVRPPGLFAHERPAADLEDAARQSRTRYFWLLDGRNDYTDFDFHWQPSRWEQDHIHVFVTQWKRDYAIFSCKQLNTDESAQARREHTVIRKSSDAIYFVDYKNPEADQRYQSLVSQGTAVHRLAYDSGLLRLINDAADRQIDAWFVDSRFDHGDFDFGWHSDVWNKDRVHTFGAGTVFASAAAQKVYTETSLEECRKYVDMTVCYDQRLDIGPTSPLDIVYVSNGEVDAEKWWNHLQNITSNATNRLLRVSDVQGRTRALRRAAEISKTPWFFVVPAKLEVSADFDWSWQPDSHLWPCHYVFHSRNPVNGLEYGHMAMVAYNRELALDTTESTLDFTMSRPYTVVPQVAGVAHYNSEPEMAWRTAFREAVKLKRSADQNDWVSSKRLACWLSLGQGINADWSQRGAQDGVDYYEQVAGDMSALLDTYHWSWLGNRFRSLYPVGLRQT